MTRRRTTTPSGAEGRRLHGTIVDERQGTVDDIAAREMLSDMRATPADGFFRTGEDPSPR